ncbi:signal peptidase I [Nonomuraea sp. NPDC050663]|uniref:signal peptidase I n=1 Tax=Nonomuraea sp. NPDC050663 TaxID=3364370 RepID=UPI0037A0A360
MRSKVLGCLLAVLPLATACGLIQGAVGVKNFQASGESMQPLLQPGETFAARLIDEDYRPNVGDVVVFNTPPGWGEDRSKPRVSRIIGLPGQLVQCCDENGMVTLDGRALHEPYLKGEPSLMRFERRVPAGRIWVMGDNRDVSMDSRSHRDAPGEGTVAVSDVIGVAEIMNE